MKDSEPLIPNDGRVLYEQLIEEGGRIVPSDKAFWAQARVLRLLKSGLAKRDPYDPPKLSPVDPKVAQARVALLWRDAMDGLRNAHSAAQQTQSDSKCRLSELRHGATIQTLAHWCRVKLLSEHSIMQWPLNGDAMVREFSGLGHMARTKRAATFRMRATWQRHQT